ncbi:MAG TPA: YkvA family protein [Micromonosporaceae bacterium]|nr:YkvA family protein [Micromonosporaceae bacterium]
MSARLRRRTALMALARAFRVGSPGLGRRLAALPRMIKASLRGEYDGGARLLLIAAASLYVISPLDAIPELFTAFIGLIDDAFVITWLTGALLSETERFLEWERAQGRGPQVIRGEVVEA